MTDVTVIVVNYRSAADALAAFASVRAETRSHRYELVLVDNDEDGGGGDLVCREAPDVRVVRPGGNPGFGAGCNAGAAVARGRWLLFLNPDARLVDGALDRCLDYLERGAGAGLTVLGCEHVEEDGALQVSSYPEAVWPGVGATLASNPLLRWAVRLFRPELVAAKDPLWRTRLHAETHETDAVQGSFLLVRSDVFAATGGFDPDFFLYFEELDWCRRVREVGGRIGYYRGARVVHATRRRHDDPAIERQAYLSEALFVLKRQGRLACAAHVLLRHVNVLGGLALYPLLGVEAKQRLRQHTRLLGFGRAHWLAPLVAYAPRLASSSRPLRAS